MEDKNLELELVSFEQAVALKELGFPQDICINKWYSGMRVLYVDKPLDYLPVSYVAPTLELVAKWLREEKNIHIQMGNFDGRLAGYSEVSYMYIMSYIKPIKSLHNCYTLYNSYEEALSAGINKAIEILKKQQQ